MKVALQRAIGAAHHEALDQRLQADEVWTRPWHLIAAYPITSLSLIEDDIWEIPTDWLPANRRARANRTVDFSKALPPGWSRDANNGLLRRLKRLCALDYLGTGSHANRHLKHSAPATWIDRCKHIVRTARRRFELFPARTKDGACPDGHSIFATLKPGEMETLRDDCASFGHICISRLNHLFAAGHFDDWPAKDVSKGRKPQRDERVPGNTPFSDEAFAHVLSAALWCADIQPHILELFLQLDAYPPCEVDYLNEVEISQQRGRLAKAASVPLGFECFPYGIELVGQGNRVVTHEGWTFETYRAVKSMLGLCQTANAVITLAATGMRIGELVDLDQNSLSTIDGRLYLTGRQSKDSDAFAGEDRHWPFPEQAVQALLGQMKLARALGYEKDLWVSFGGTKNKTGVVPLGEIIQNFGTRFRLPDGRLFNELDGNVTAQRFRFTVSRLAGLSLAGASQILFDVLGHNDSETTLGYLMRDPEIRQIASNIRNEVKAVRSKQIFEHAADNGGPAAGFILRAKENILARSGKEELDTEDLIEAQAILGEAEEVKPGVLCTAQPLERGLCSSTQGIRDHGSCTPSCKHRLELAAAIQDHRAKSLVCLQRMRTAKDGMRIFFRNQLLAHFEAFPAIASELSIEQLSEAFDGCSSETWAHLAPNVANLLDRSVGR